MGWTINFPQSGGRKVTPNKRTKGTTVKALIPWNQHQATDLAHRLTIIRPPDTTIYSVNGHTVTRCPSADTARAPLPTIIQREPGQPLRTSTRVTDIEIIAPDPDSQNTLYEMGIPIQPIAIPYHVDVMQKVPMPPNRDTVSDAYLKQLYTIVLNQMHTQMETEAFADAWVKTAIENNRISEPAVKQTIKQRYGDKVVTWSSDTDANMKAIDNGYQVLHPRTMSKPELSNMRRLGGLQGARALFGRDDDPGPPLDTSGDTVKEEFAQWVRDLGRLLGLDIITNFVNNPTGKTVASCTLNTTSPVMTFNTDHLDGATISSPAGATTNSNS